MNRKELTEDLVIANMEFVSSMTLEQYDAFVTDLLYSYFGKFSLDELMKEKEALGV